MKFDDHFIAWIFIYSMGAFLSITLLTYFNFINSLSGVIISGWVITLLAWAMYSLLYDNQFVLNKWFFIWIFVHSVNFWWIDLILRKLSLTYNGFLYFLMFGLAFHIVTWLIKHHLFGRIRMNSTKAVISVIILVALLFFISAQPFSEISSIGFSGNSSLAFSLSSIRNSLTLSSFSFGTSCPQISVPILNGKLGNYISNSDDIKGVQGGWTISVYNVAEMFGLSTDFVFCHRGNLEGENPSYTYCDSGWMGKGIPYISKTSTNSDGTIGKTIRKSFVNVYTSEGNLIKTICGEDPVTIAEKDFKKTMRELDDLFSLK